MHEGHISYRVDTSLMYTARCGDPSWSIKEETRGMEKGRLLLPLLVLRSSRASSASCILELRYNDQIPRQAGRRAIILREARTWVKVPVCFIFFQVTVRDCSMFITWPNLKRVVNPNPPYVVFTTTHVYYQFFILETHVYKVGMPSKNI